MLVLFNKSNVVFEWSVLLAKIHIIKKSLHSGQVAHQANAYLWFLWHEATRSISTPPWMGRQSITGLPFSIKFAGAHLYSWVETCTVRVKCLAQEHNTMSPARA